MSVSLSARKALRDKSGIMLDIGCGGEPQAGMVGLDIRELPGVDIVHDLEEIPYPLPDDCCISILASHVLEHINPARGLFVQMMNELWRIMKPKGRLLVSTPYAGSQGYWQDPTHCNPISQVTIAYFAPAHPSGLYNIYKPRPWTIVANAWLSNGNLEVVLEKIPEANLDSDPQRKGPRNAENALASTRRGNSVRARGSRAVSGRGSRRR